VRAAAVGTVLESVGLPRPKLVKLAAGEDYEEKTAIHIEPAQVGIGGESQPLWGRYHITITYSASYINAEEIVRSVALRPWQGEVNSNSIEIELLPPTGQGSLSGRVINPAGEYLTEALVSLSNEQEQPIEQAVTGFEGRFSFAHLPAGFYWVTSRLEHASYDTAFFRHVELAAAPESTLDMVYIAPNVLKGTQMLHKPVLFRVFDEAGRPFGKVALEVSFMNGTVMEDKKLNVADDGTVATELIPGLNYVSVKRHGCASQLLRIEVTAGDGIDAFKLVADCPSR
jgi:hypothetical protein